MISLNYFIAKVVDNDDGTNAPDKQKLARIQVRLEPEMKDVQAKYLPWIKPFIIDGLNVPQIDDYVWVVYIDRYFKEGFYINDKLFLENFFDYDDMETDIEKIDEVGSISYPDLKCRKYEDGTIEFHNVSTGAHGVYHKSGAYQIIDPDGNIYSKDKNDNKISMDTTGVVIEDINGNDISMVTGKVTINGNLEVLQ